MKTKSITLPELPGCEFFISNMDDKSLQLEGEISIGMIKDEIYYGMTFPFEYDSGLLGKVNLSGLSHREMILMGISGLLAREQK